LVNDGGTTAFVDPPHRRIVRATKLKSNVTGEPTMLILTNEDVEQILVMPECVAALEDAYRDFGNQDAAESPSRPCRAVGRAPA
jgi:hypothetical protein